MDIKKHLTDQITVAKSRIAEINCSSEVIAEQEAVSKKFYELTRKGEVDTTAEAFTGYIAFLDKYTEATESANLQRLITSLNESLALDLVEVKTRFLVCGLKALVSPAGFHTSDRVFIQPVVAIHTNRLKGKKFPQGVELFAHDIDAIASK